MHLSTGSSRRQRLYPMEIRGSSKIGLCNTDSDLFSKTLIMGVSIVSSGPVCEVVERYGVTQQSLAGFPLFALVR